MEINVNVMEKELFRVLTMNVNNVVRECENALKTFAKEHGGTVKFTDEQVKCYNFIVDSTGERYGLGGVSCKTDDNDTEIERLYYICYLFDDDGMMTKKCLEIDSILFSSMESARTLINIYYLLFDE